MAAHLARTPRTARSRRARGGAAGALAAALVAALVPASPAQAALAAVGPIDATHGYPEWFEDANGVRLAYCVDPAEGCVAELPNPGAPVSFPDNFSDEAFWFMAETSSGNLGLYEAALEGAFVNEAVVDGDQHAFGRIRIRMDGLVPDATYTITHPYGVEVLEAEPDPKDPTLGRINHTDDQGCMATPCGDFGQVRDAFLGDASGTSATWLTQVGAPAGTLGDMNVSASVTGSPFGTNFVRVEGPNAGGPGIDVLQVDTFGIMGKVVERNDNIPRPPDLAAASDSGASATDNLTNVTAPTFTGTVAAGSAVDLLVGGAVVVSGTADAGGAYALTATGLGEGLHSVAVRVPNPDHDPLDPNETDPPTLTSGTLKIAVDVTSPVSTIGPTPVGRPSLTSADRTPTFSWTTNEAGSTSECSLRPASATTDAYEPCTSPLTYDEQLYGEYTFSTRATDRAGNLGAPASYTWRIASDTPAPGQPVIGAATRGNGSARVTWTAPAAGGPVATYTVNAYVGTSNTVAGSVTVAGGTLAATVTGLTNGTSYTLDVTATNDGGTGPTSARSNAVTPATTPDAPGIGTATAGNASASLTWTAPGDNGGSPLTGYRIRVFVGTATTPARTVDVGTVTSATVSNLTNGTTYSFDVRSRNALGLGGTSARSNTVVPAAVASVPGAPTIGTATRGNARATVRWSAPASNGGSAITGYRIRAFTGTTLVKAVSTGAAARRVTVTGLVNGTTYTFDVAAVNGIGRGPFSARSNAVTPAKVPTAPPIGTASPGVAGGAVTATARWGVPTSDGGADINGYRVTALRMSASGTVLAKVVSQVQPASARQLTMTLPSGNYRFRVQARNAVGFSPLSARSNLVAAR